jgi:hypothetical protein
VVQSAQQVNLHFGGLSLFLWNVLNLDYLYTHKISLHLVPHQIDLYKETTEQEEICSTQQQYEKNKEREKMHTLPKLPSPRMRIGS